MSLSSIWASLAKENDYLRLYTISAIFAAATCGIGFMTLALKDPVVIERACYSKILNTMDNKRSEDEIVNFLKIAIEMRFNTETHAPDNFLSLDQLTLRESEQDEIKRRSMKQSVLVNKVIFDDKLNTTTVDVDKLISVGNIRSAFKFPVLVKFELTARTEANPYGLILTQVLEANIEKERKNKDE